ncbi:MAG: T9SS type A sorting domain-containing protein [Chitinophagales bacterium]
MKQFKNLFFIGLLCLLANTILAQETQLEQTFNHSFTTHCSTFEYAGNGEWILGGYETPSCHWFNEVWFTKIDAQGEALWNIYPPALFEIEVESGNIFEIEVLENGDILALFNVYGTDVISEDDGVYVCKVSGDGEPIWSQRISEAIWEVQNGHIDAFDDNSFVVNLNEESILLYSEIGELITSENSLSYANANALSIKNNTQILVAADNNLHILNNVGVLENTISFEETVKKISVTENNALLMLQTSLVWLDNDYNIYHTQDYSLTFSSLTSVAMAENGQAWLLGKDAITSESRIEFVPIPFTLPPIYTVNIADSLTKANDIKLFENGFAVAGNEYVVEDNDSFIGEPHHAFIKTFSQAGGQTTTEQYDIELVNSVISNFESLTNYILFDVETIVKNNGDTPIYSFDISMVIENPIGVMCVDKYLHFKHENIVLMPQETITVTAEDISSQDFGSIEACVWASGVNDALDINHSNNEFCGNLEIVGISENTTNWNIGVFPNPTADYFSLEIEEEVFMQAKDKTISVFDNLGRKVFENTLENANETINMQDFSAGVYIVQLNMDGKLWSEKLMKY